MNNEEFEPHVLRQQADFAARLEKQEASFTARLEKHQADVASSLELYRATFEEIQLRQTEAQAELSRRQAEFQAEQSRLHAEAIARHDRVDRQIQELIQSMSIFRDVLISLTHHAERHEREMADLIERGKQTDGRLNALIIFVERHISGHQ